MTQYCQFCDKEMILDVSVVTIDGYITCGAEPCVAKAISNTKHYDKIEREKEHPSIIESHIVIFQTKTPYDPSSWRLTPVEDHPDFMDSPEVVAEMLKGTIVNIPKPNHINMFYYRAEKVKDIKKQLGDRINA